MMITSRHRDELEEKGYTVIENAVPDHAQLKQGFFDWMKRSFPDGTAPYSTHSLVRNYGIGHFEETWAVRLEVKKYFAQLWGTDQLLSSVDAVAIGQPPEEGVEDFDGKEYHWLHVDQCAARIGLHAYQGAVYLETADEDDWTFEVLEGSHEHLSAFYAINEKAKIRSVHTGQWRMRSDDLEWFLSKGCEQKRVAVKAGGLVLWDSRLVHANARPVKGRTHPDRWRLAVLVCMCPAAWSTSEDIKVKKDAYNKMLMTTHWPCDDVRHLSRQFPSYAARSKTPEMTSLPEIAKTLEARQLVGVTPYKVTPSTKVAAWRPKWDEFWRPDMAKKTTRMYTGNERSLLNKLLWSLVFVFLITFIVHIVL